MADYSFGYGGVGSGLDISSIVSQLVAADRAPHDARLNKLEASAKFKLSGLGNVTSALNSLKSALDSLQKSDALAARAVTSSAVPTGGTAGSGDPVLSASVGRNTPLGRYQVEVLELASAHKLAGGGIDPEATFQAGTLRLTIGDESVDIEIAADSDLSAIRDAIIDAAGKHGVQAAVLTSDAGQHLSLGSAKTGAQNRISIEVVSGGADLHGLVDGLVEQSPAADARISIDGLISTSSTNTFSDAVPGLRLQVKQTGSSTVDVTGDANASRAAVEAFVKAYNNALKAVASATKYDPETKTPSSLTGDAQMRGVASQLRGMMGSLLGELAAQGLDAKTLGLQTQGHPNPDGSLVLDASKFDAALAENPARIAAALTGETGLAARLNEVVKGYVGADGALTLRTQGLNDQIKDITKQREALEIRMENVAKRYQAQFVALDSLMAQMSSTSNYLSQQLAALAAQTKSS